MRNFNEDDLRAAVAAGHVNEVQAATIMALAADRHNQRQALDGNDEPFELFRGFNEVFISIGIALVAAGWIGLAVIGGVQGAGVMALAGVLAWLGAEYFTRRRRMMLPSFLLTAFIVACALLFAIFAFAGIERPGQDLALCFAFATLIGGAFYWRFKVPFAWFAIGLMVILATLTSIGVLNYGNMTMVALASPMALFDFGSGIVFPLVTLCLGMLGFAVAMRFDLSDPHRLSRRSSCAFWLHVLAAPAIVNTVAMSLFNSGIPAATVLLVITILAIAVLALVIDRRSFLVSAILYVWLLSRQALGEESDGIALAPLVLLSLGFLIAYLGASWTSLRGRIMRQLPNFPGKAQLPPFAASA